jgi:hypothetical protein
MPKKVNTRAKAKTIARAKAVAKRATTVARVRIPVKAKVGAQLTEVSHKCPKRFARGLHF